MFNFKLRPIEESDTNFILKSWIRTAKNTHQSWGMEEDIFCSEHERVVKQAIIHCSKDSLIACDMEDSEHIYGFLIGKCLDQAGLIGVDVLHFYYVRSYFRKAGIGGGLIKAFLKDDSAKDVVTTLKGMDNLLKGHKVLYNPYFLINSAYTENNNGN